MVTKKKIGRPLGKVFSGSQVVPLKKSEMRTFRRLAKRHKSGKLTETARDCFLRGLEEMECKF